MRRVLMFAAFLLLVGLTTATAASFDVQAEDITSFSTTPSISVPPPPPSGAITYYVRGSTSPGVLSTDPTSGGSTESATFAPGTGSVLAEATPPQNNRLYYFVWRTGPLTSRLALDQSVRFHFFVNGAGDVVHAALLDCPESEPEVSTGCVAIREASGTGSTEVVDFGRVTHTIELGRELRLKVANRDAKQWNLQWGFKSNRTARLEILEPTP